MACRPLLLLLELVLCSDAIRDYGQAQQPINEVINTELLSNRSPVLVSPGDNILLLQRQPEDKY